MLCYYLSLLLVAMRKLNGQKHLGRERAYWIHRWGQPTQDSGQEPRGWKGDRGHQGVLLMFSCLFHTSEDKLVKDGTTHGAINHEVR